MNNYICKVKIVHYDKVNSVKEKISDISIDKIADTMKCFADKNRLKILLSLYFDDELCVCDIANIINSSMAIASHHLCYLADKKIVTRIQKGKLVTYRLSDHQIQRIISTTLNSSQG